jgi:transposase-like protein
VERAVTRQQFKRLEEKLPSLTRHQQRRLLDNLQESFNRSETITVIESRYECNDRCPRCSEQKIQRWGKRHGLQRYRCKSCQRTFNALTGTPLARLRHKERWLSYSDSLREGYSVRRSAKENHLDPSTAFRWRHRFLSTPTHNQSVKMAGIVEADETFFAKSFKGNKHLTHRAPRKRGMNCHRRGPDRIPVLLIRDRLSTVADFVYDKLEKAKVHQDLKSVMSEEIVLCTDGSSLYKTFSQQENIPHKRLVGLSNQRVVDDIFHIQNLNVYTSRLKQWIRRFNGVSTKYLENYLGWRRLIEKKCEGEKTGFYLKQVLNFC